MNTSHFLANKTTILLSIWYLLILGAEFYFYFTYLSINGIPQETYTATSYLSRARFGSNYLAILVLINSLLVLLGLKWKGFARALLIFIDPILVLLAVVVLSSAYSTTCEGLGCFGLALVAFGAVSILGSVLTHAPLLFLVLQGAHRKTIGVTMVLFVLLTITVPYSTSFYLAKTLPKKTEIGISRAIQKMGITIFKPSYLPDRKIYRYFEGVHDLDKYPDQYYMDYFYEGGVDGGGLQITQTVPQGRVAEAEKYGASKFILNGNPAAISTIGSIQKDSHFFTSITWIDSGTEIRLRYDGIGAKELIEAEAIKIAESMRPLSK